MRDGWLRLSREAAGRRGVQFDNQSVGASTSLYMAYRLHDLNLLNQVDRVVVDFCINDQIYIDAGIYDIPRAEGHYLVAFRQLAQRNMLSKTVVLLFPQQRFAVSGEACHLIERIRALCRQFGVKVLDAGPIVIALATDRHEDVSNAYTDPRHFAPEYQRIIGQAVLSHLRSQTWCSPTVWANRRALRIIPAACIHPLGIQPVSNMEKISVGTSLARREVLPFPHNARATVSGARWLLGVFHWTHSNSGVFCLTGPGEQRRFHLRRAWENIFLFDDVSPPFPLHAGGAALHAANMLTVPFKVLQGQHSSVYDCKDATVDLVALVGSDLLPTELLARGRRCHAQCAMPLSHRLVRGFYQRLIGAVRKIRRKEHIS